MAGSNLSGYQVSRPDLFKGALVIVTPTAASSRLRSTAAPCISRTS
jgi:hypothetical protein